MDSEQSVADAGGRRNASATARCHRSWHRRALRKFGPGLLALALCTPVAQAAGPAVADGSVQGAAQASRTPEESRMWMTVGERRFAITLADTEAARALAARLPLTLDMEELNGNEKKKELPQALPTATLQPGTIRTGDLLLWGSRTAVVFYQTFDSSYSYTRLGRVDDPAGLARVLGRGDVRIAFSKH